MPRTGEVATLLQNGQVLVTGGFTGSYPDYTASSELFDPASGTWAATGPMANARQDHTATLLPDGHVLVAGGVNSSSLATAELYDPSTGTWTATGNMATARYWHTATLLPDGHVLVAGGCGSSSRCGLASAELYGPSTGTWTPTGSMSTARSGHTATLLANGQVLVTGGCACSTTEVFDPSTGTWSLTGSMNYRRYLQTATLLQNNQVLVVGGDTGGSPYDTASAELYDPATGTWVVTGSMAYARQAHTATLLPDGRVLVAGGENVDNYTTFSSAEVYGPTTGTWAPVGALAAARYGHAATLLQNGQVLVAGGTQCCDSSGYATYLASTELFTPGITPYLVQSTTELTYTGQLVGTHSLSQTVTLTNTGPVPLVVSSVSLGGTSSGDYAVASTCTAGAVAPGGTCAVTADFAPLVTGTLTATINVVDNAPTSPQSIALSGSGRGPNAWSATGSMTIGRTGQTATLLSNGQALVAGGCSNICPTSSAELYNPSTGTWTPTGSMTTVREYHTATRLPNGQVLVAGGCDGTYVCTYSLSSAELYNPATGTWAVTGSMATARVNHTATLLADGQVLVAGGCTNGACGAIISSAELYTPSTGIWHRRGNLTRSRAFHTATLLPNGKVLIAGGCARVRHVFPPTTSAELFDPSTGTFTITASMDTARDRHTATLLPNGLVLVAGGYTTASGGDTSSAELYNPSGGTWAPTGAMSTAHEQHTATLLPNGQVLVAGGISTSSAELYNPSTGTWVLTGAMSVYRGTDTATLLPTGNVLVAGGSYVNPIANVSVYLSSAELYTPALLSVSPVSGTFGQTLTLTGTNFYAHETVNIYGDSTSNPVLYTASSGVSGSFVLTSAVRQGPYGPHTLIAVGQRSQGTATTTFTVQPELTLSPLSGSAGSTVTATGYGFGADEAVALYWAAPGSALLGTATSNTYGTFAGAGALTFTVPAAAPGTDTVYAIGQTTGAQATATFTVT